MCAAAMSMVIPSMASAGTAAQALSVKSAAVQPVRASSKQGQEKAVPKALIIVAVLAAVGGLIAIIASGDSN